MVSCDTSHLNGVNEQLAVALGVVSKPHLVQLGHLWQEQEQEQQAQGMHVHRQKHVGVVGAAADKYSTRCMMWMGNMRSPGSFDFGS